jgi:hypothetical protein
LKLWMLVAELRAQLETEAFARYDKDAHLPPENEVFERYAVETVSDTAGVVLSISVAGAETVVVEDAEHAETAADDAGVGFGMLAVAAVAVGSTAAAVAASTVVESAVVQHAVAIAVRAHRCAEEDSRAAVFPFAVLAAVEGPEYAVDEALSVAIVVAAEELAFAGKDVEDSPVI